MSIRMHPNGRVTSTGVLNKIVEELRKKNFNIIMFDNKVQTLGKLSWMIPSLRHIP